MKNNTSWTFFKLNLMIVHVQASVNINPIQHYFQYAFISGKYFGFLFTQNVATTLLKMALPELFSNIYLRQNISVQSGNFFTMCSLTEIFCVILTQLS